MSVVRAEHLRIDIRPHFWSRTRQILADVSLEVAAGEIFGFLGPNGAGKTTTIKTLLGLVAPTAGSVQLLGRPPNDTAVRRRVGYMPERADYPGQLSARELVRLHGMLAGLSRGAAPLPSEAVLEQVGLRTRAGERLRTYSKGMLQRAGLAQALVGDPEIVILDEPMSGLDPLGRRDVRELMLALRAGGKTVFFSTHILPDVEMICDRVGIVVAGRTTRTGRPAELVGDAAAPVEISTAPCTHEERAALEPLADRCTAQSGGWVWQTSDLESANSLLDALRARQIRVDGMQVVRRTLEDLFVGEAAREELP